MAELNDGTKQYWTIFTMVDSGSAVNRECFARVSRVRPAWIQADVATEYDRVLFELAIS